MLKEDIDPSPITRKTVTTTFALWAFGDEIH